MVKRAEHHLTTAQLIRNLQTVDPSGELHVCFNLEASYMNVDGEVDPDNIVPVGFVESGRPDQPEEVWLS